MLAATSPLGDLLPLTQLPDTNRVSAVENRVRPLAERNRAAVMPADQWSVMGF